jgi:hypothetical protein
MVKCHVDHEFIIDTQAGEAAIRFGTHGNWKRPTFMLSQTVQVAREKDVVTVTVKKDGVFKIGLRNHPFEITDFIFAIVFHAVDIGSTVDIGSSITIIHSSSIVNA